LARRASLVSHVVTAQRLRCDDGTLAASSTSAVVLRGVPDALLDVLWDESRGAEKNGITSWLAHHARTEISLVELDEAPVRCPREQVVRQWKV